MKGKMSDHLPPHALLCWVDDRNVYCCVPYSGVDDGYVSKFPLTEGGLSKALNLLRQRRIELPLPAASHEHEDVTGHIARIHASKKPRKAAVTDEQKADALAKLKKLGLV